MNASVRPSAAAVALAMYASGLILFSPQLALLVERWSRASGDSHGWLVLVAVPALIWARRGSIVSSSDDSRVLPVLCLLLAGVTMALASAAAIDVIGAALIPLSILLSVWVALGRASLRSLAGPILYFFFAIPVWGALIPLLQKATIVASPAILSVFGVPSLISGSLVTVPAGTFEIAEGCAGEHFFVVGLAIAALITLVDGLPKSKAVRLACFSVAMAIVTNWIRVAVIIYIGNATSMRSSLVRDHGALGWWLFAAALIPIFIYARALGGHSAVAEVSVPTTNRVAGPKTVWIVAAVGLMALGPVWSWTIAHADVGQTPSWALPVSARWVGPTTGGSDWRPEFPGASLELAGRYVQGSEFVDLYGAYYARQTSGKKLIGFDSSFAGAGWVELSRSAVDTDSGRVLELVIGARSGDKRLVWSWYEVRGRRITSTTAVKLRQALGAFGLRDWSGGVALSAPCRPACDDARQVLLGAFRDGIDGISLRAHPDAP